ncbi:MAG: flippase activity-associated protein Agl23 [Chloroflexota bacterium]
MTELTTPPQEKRADFLSQPLLLTLNIDWEKAIYIAFIILAIITRFWDLGSRVMSHDESLHTQFSFQFYNGDGYSHTPLMHGPFLFHITAVSYWLFGDGDLAARIPVAIFGVLLVAVPYLLRDWIGRVGALFASFILLVSPYVTYYSRYIRHDVYIIIWALIVFISAWYYLHNRQDKYLWWFAAGTALMFTTKEVSFIYVAIFGSFFILRLLGRVSQTDLWQKHRAGLMMPLGLVLLSLVLVFGGYLAQRQVSGEGEAAATSETGEGFAVDPTAENSAEAAAAASSSETFFRWVVVLGIGVLAAGLFLVAVRLRPDIDQHPEFDLIVLFTTLILPSVSPFLTQLAGWNPQDYTINTCMLEGQESMSALQLLFARAGNSICWSSLLESGSIRSGIFLVITLIVSILVGMWWDRQRWPMAAIIYHGIFLVLFTSVFTNPGGWISGKIGSLGYWLEQQEVQRGSQPWFYYFFVMPFYEFLPVIFSTTAVGLWMRQKRIGRTLGFFLLVILLAALGYSLAIWQFTSLDQGVLSEPNRFPGYITAAVVLIGGVLVWFAVLRKQFAADGSLRDNLRDLLKSGELFGLMPFLTWWLLLTWAAYTIAGEKMPWLSIHFVIPMAFMVGWYFNERLTKIENPFQSLLSRPALSFLGITVIFIIAIALAAGPLLLGQIEFGNQELGNLTGIGRFFGSVLLAAGVYYLWQRLRANVSTEAIRPLVVLSVFVLLSLLTIRFTYMANFLNADYTTEYMVYAHGAPATKDVVMDQVEALSMRLNGDKGIRVAFDNDVSWPFTWYLREYPNRNYFGENPSQTLNESPVIIVGRKNWDAVDPYLSKNYEYREYTFLWWPMEEYRNISWNGVFGTQTTERGLGNPGVRQALWDIFFYRDYQRYGEIFGGTYTSSEWPLRHPLRLYIRKDVVGELWDYGVGAVSIAGLEDPYEEKELTLSPSLVINEPGFERDVADGLNAPRNIAIAPNGRLVIADSGNHRIQLFDADGSQIRSWGSFGTEPGQLNEPWGIAADSEFVYVADTWNHRLQKFTYDGELVAVFGQSGSPSPDSADEQLGLFFGPRSITLVGDNQLLVTDTGNHRMQLLDRDGNFIRQVGQFGNNLGELNEPVGIASGPNGQVFLADTWNGRIQQFNNDVLPLFEWTVDAWDGTSINNKPYLAVDSQNRVYVTDPEGYRILIFNSDGTYIGRFGDFGTDANSLGLPNGIAIDAQDNVYIADAGNHRILKFEAPFGSVQE